LKVIPGAFPKAAASCGIGSEPCAEIQVAKFMYDAASSWSTTNWEW
jgi:hypothetical protein